jgi:hypothetical protein
MILYILYALTILAFISVVATLLIGAVSMARTSEDSRKASNKWMARRVTTQAIAIILLVITVYYRGRTGA